MIRRARCFVVAIAALVAFGACGDADESAPVESEILVSIRDAIATERPELTEEEFAPWLGKVEHFVRAYWNDASGLYPDAAGEESTAIVRIVQRGETIPTSCEDADGAAMVADDSWLKYLGCNDHIYLSSPRLYEKYQSGQGYGDFAAAIIVAHEWGHNVQREMGLRTHKTHSEYKELQADCFAGLWAQHEDREGRLETGDIEEALSVAWDSPGGNHGTPGQRVEAMMTGYKTKKGPAGCFKYGPPPESG